MHPNPAFRHDDPVLLEALVDEIGFGMVFLTTPDGPRVAHTPLLATGDGAVQFHLSRGNALAKYIDGATALILVNGPEGYVSPRFYSDQTNVPTWNYIAVELEGRVRRMSSEGLLGFLEAVSEKYEAQLDDGEPWTMDQVPEPKMRKLLSGIIGFELEIQAWRPTFKLSQNKSQDERNRVATGLQAAGSTALAELMRQLAP
jgi:transcriptional regulator